MPMHQTSPIDGPERSEASARPGSALGTWLGALALTIVGILVFPGAIDDLSSFEAATLTQDRETPRLVSPPSTSQRAPQVVAPSVLRISFPVEATEDLDRSPHADRVDASSADSPAMQRLGRRVLRGVFEGLKQGWERLGRASIVVRDLTPDEGQRIPASFIPSRS